jgi:hypothetical protein
MIGGTGASAARVTPTQVFEAGVDPRPALSRYRSAAWPLPEFVAASRGLGLVSRAIRTGRHHAPDSRRPGGRSGADAEFRSRSLPGGRHRE